MQTGPDKFHLDPDQLDAVRRILRRAGVTNSNTAQVLATKVAATIAQHVATTNAKGYAVAGREVHDQLRALYRSAEEPDPPMGLIRARLKELPKRILAEIEERAERRWSIYIDEPAPPRSTAGWLARLPADQLLKLLPPSLATGGMIVRGRGRGSSRRSRPHFEPLIGGVVRGAPPSSGVANPSGGGRPRDDDALGLIAFLAVDWAFATDKHPEPGRSDNKPFGNLVHQVFGWLELPDATGALRRYWREWARRANRKSIVSFDWDLG